MLCIEIGKCYEEEKCLSQNQIAMFWYCFNAQLLKNHQPISLCFEKTSKVPFYYFTIPYFLNEKISKLSLMMEQHMFHVNILHDYGFQRSKTTLVIEYSHKVSDQ